MSPTYLPSIKETLPRRQKPPARTAAHCKVIHVPIGTTRRMKMVASQCRRPMTGGRFASSASSLGKVGPEHSKETRSVAPRRCREARIRESFQDECSFGLG